MPQGRTALLKPHLTPSDVLHLQRLLRAHSTPYGVARRAQILLALHGNMTQSLAASTYGITRQHIRKWIQRWNERGMEGIMDRRGGRPRRHQEGATLSSHHNPN